MNSRIPLYISKLQKTFRHFVPLLGICLLSSAGCSRCGDVGHHPQRQEMERLEHDAHVRDTSPIRQEAPKPFHHPGIVNLATTCYMNSTLHILAAFYPDIFTSHRTVKSIDEVSRTGQVIIEKLKESAEPVTREEAEAFYQALVSELKWGKNTSQQHDAAEFMGKVLEAINKTNSLRTGSLLRKLPATEDAPAEGGIRYTAEPFDGVGFGALKVNVDDSMQAAIDDLFSEEVIEGFRWGDGYQERTGKNFKVEPPLPDLLPVQVKRFGGESSRQKLGDLLKNPACITIRSTFQHAPEGTNAKDVTYTLQGFIEHRGRSTRSGHYVAYIKHGDQWERYSDMIVSQVSETEAEAAAEEAYLLFYSKDSSARSAVPAAG